MLLHTDLETKLYILCEWCVHDRERERDYAAWV